MAMKAVPSCAATAPRASTAAIPAPSLIPPAGNHGKAAFTHQQTCQGDRAEPIVGSSRVKRAAKTASFQPLCHNCINAGSLDRARFRNAGCGCEEDNAASL